MKIDSNSSLAIFTVLVCCYSTLAFNISCSRSKISKRNTFTVQRAAFLRAVLKTRSGTKLFQKNLQRDENGYEIKPKDWFNGLSLDPGGSLTDPRAVPPEAREFAEKIKADTIDTTYQSSIDMINKHYNYFEVH
jgi:hypothetical protein